MANVAKAVEDRILGRGLIATEIVSAEARRRIVEALIDHRSNHDAAVAAVRRILEKYENGLLRLFPPTKLAAWVAGAREVARKTPSATLEAIGGGGEQIPRVGREGAETPEEPLVEFPILTGAEEFLEEKAAISREEFDQLTDEFRREAFTIAGEIEVETIERVQSILIEDIESGTSLAGFRKKVEETIDEGTIGPAHLETVYRTNVQTAFAEGHDKLANNPIVAEVFPFIEYLPIDDGRVRDDHFELGSLGLDGTGIYWRDDPMWRHFRPPWDFNCRCGVNLLTREQAASRGVRAAQEWIDTGAEPQHESRLDFIPFRPTNDFVGPTGFSTIRLATFDETKVKRDAGKFSKQAGRGAEEKEKPALLAAKDIPDDWTGEVEFIDESGAVLDTQPAEEARQNIKDSIAEGDDLPELRVRQATAETKLAEDQRRQEIDERRTKTIAEIREREKLGNRPGGVDWKPLPPKLFHATYAADAILEGGFKSAEELGGDADVLGGSVRTGVSFADLETVTDYRDGLNVARLAARGELNPDDPDTLAKLATRFGVSEEFMAKESARSDRPGTDPAKRMFEILQATSFEGKKFPLFMGGNWSKTVASSEPPQIVEIETEGVENVSYHKSENEWRIHDPKQIKGTKLLQPTRLSTLHLAFDESKVKRDAGKFSKEAGGKKEEEEGGVSEAAFARMRAANRRMEEKEKKDQAVVNVPLSKRGGGSLNAQIDRNLKKVAAEKKKKAKEFAAQKKLDIGRARELFDKFAGDLAASTAAKSDQSAEAVKKFLAQMIKDEPAKARALLERFEKQVADQPKPEEELDQASGEKETDETPAMKRGIVVHDPAQRGQKIAGPKRGSEHSVEDFLAIMRKKLGKNYAGAKLRNGRVEVYKTFRPGGRVALATTAGFLRPRDDNEKQTNEFHAQKEETRRKVNEGK